MPRRPRDRWRDWAAPDGPKRTELQLATFGAFFGFVKTELIPHLKKLREQPNATSRQKVISEIFSGVEHTRIDTERNLLDILDKVHEISSEAVDPTHVFTLSQVYEGLLLKMGEKGNDGGQFFTPREVIRAMVRVIDPKIGETVYDPAGTLHCSSGRRCRRKAPIRCFPGRHSGPAWWQSCWWPSTWCFGSGSVVNPNCF